MPTISTVDLDAVDVEPGETISDDELDRQLNSAIRNMVDESDASLHLVHGLIKKLATFEILIRRDPSDERLIQFVDHLALLADEFTEQADAFANSVQDFHDLADAVHADPADAKESAP